MKRIQWISGMLAVAALLGSSVSFADDNPFQYIKQGYERTTINDSTFDLSHGASKKLQVPHGPRDLDQLLVLANTGSCQLSKIVVTVSSESGSTESQLVQVNSQPNWYFLKYGMEGAREITVTHQCGHNVTVRKIEADLGAHAVDCVFQQCQNPGGDCPKIDLSFEIIRRMPKEGKYAYLLDALDRLAWKTVDFLKLGSDDVKFYISPITDAIIQAKSVALVQGDGSLPTMKQLIRVRAIMSLSDKFFLGIANTKVSKPVGEAYFTVETLIEDQTRMTKKDIEDEVQACLTERENQRAQEEWIQQQKMQFQQQLQQNQGQRPRPNQQQQQIPPKPRKGAAGLDEAGLPRPQDDRQNQVEQIPPPANQEPEEEE